MGEIYEIYTLIDKNPLNLSMENRAPLGENEVNGTPKIGEVLEMNVHLGDKLRAIVHCKIVALIIPKKIILSEISRTQL